MTPPLTLYATAKDIREGVPVSAGECAIARAMTRAIIRVMKVEPHHVTISAGLVAHIPEGMGWVNHWWSGSTALREWISDFDQGRPVKPATFRITPSPTCDGCTDH